MELTIAVDEGVGVGVGVAVVDVVNAAAEEDT